MWKTLRNVALAVILLAGVLKLFAWYSVGQDVPRVIAMLAPYAKLKYASLSTDLNGRVTLTDVRIQSVPSQHQYHAQKLTFAGPSLFWLVKHALLQENTLPDTFSIKADNLSLPAALPWLKRAWLDPVTFVPFPDQACGNRPLGPGDYRRMGLNGAITNHARLRYAYNDEDHKLHLNLSLLVPGFSKTSAELEIARYDPYRLSLKYLTDQLHVDEMSMNYTDSGYMKRRAEFCAARTGVSAAQFVNAHVDAVAAMLQAQGIQASDPLTRLYRRLVSNGGGVSALSLPTRDFLFGTWREIGREAAWRQLNVTVRYENSPPIMFGLAFNPATSEPASTSTSVGPVTSIQPAPIPKPPVGSIAMAPALNPTSGLLPKLSVPLPGMASNDRASRKDSRPNKIETKPVSARPLQPARAARAPVRTMADVEGFPVLPSSPRPPPGSTMALVWQPAIDPLPPAPVPVRDYTVIDFDRLKQEIGRRVRLITLGDNAVSGQVASVDNSSVHLLIERSDGSARFDIARSRIRQIQLINN